MQVIANYIFVQVCILLFFAPFYFLYRIRSTPKKFISISQEIENFFLSKWANYLVFFWAFGEALFWFVIPEFLLLLLVFMRIKRKKQLLTYDVAGTIVGTLFAFTLRLSDLTIAKIPYIQDKMIEQTLIWYDKQGIFALFNQPFSGVPYKVFTLTANRYDFFIIAFILLAVVVRMSRYLIFFGLFVGLYPGLHKFVKKNYLALFLIATFIFSIFLVKVVNNYR